MGLLTVLTAKYQVSQSLVLYVNFYLECDRTLLNNISLKGYLSAVVFYTVFLTPLHLLVGYLMQLKNNINVIYKTP